MALINNTYFIREINLPGVSLTADMTTYITRYEKQVLLELLGYPLYKDYLANATDQRWVDLIEGKEYTVTYLGETTTVKWNGLQNTDLVSLISYYVFYYYMKFHATFTARTGEGVTEKENAKGTSPIPRMVSAWNNCIDLYGCVNDVVINPTAYNFLKNVEDDYEGWIFTPLYKENEFGI